MIPPRLHTTGSAGRSTMADLAHLGDVAPVADRVAAAWRRALPAATRTRSALRMALQAHEAALARLFAKGSRMAHVSRALAARGVTVGGRPITRAALGMAWLRLERARADASAREMAA